MTVLTSAAEEVVLAPHDALRHARGAARVEQQQVVAVAAPRAAARPRRCRPRRRPRRAWPTSGHAPGAVVDPEPQLDPGQPVADALDALGEGAVEHDRDHVAVVPEVDELVVEVAVVRVDGHQAGLEGRRTSTRGTRGRCRGTGRPCPAPPPPRRGGPGPRRWRADRAPPTRSDGRPAPAPAHRGSAGRRPPTTSAKFQPGMCSPSCRDGRPVMLAAEPILDRSVKSGATLPRWTSSCRRTTTPAASPCGAGWPTTRRRRAASSPRPATSRRTGRARGASTPTRSTRS